MSRCGQTRPALCGATDSYLDEVLMDDAGTRTYVCSDTDFAVDGWKPPKKETADEPAEVSGLSKSYGSHIGCADVGSELYPGEVGIVGESGSGKTTLLRCLAGHLEPDTGSRQLCHARRGTPRYSGDG